MRGGDRVAEKFMKQALGQPGAALVEAEAVSESGGNSDHTTTFKVIDSWVGATGETVKVNHGTSSAACGVTFKVGERVFLLATPINGGLRTNLCAQLMASRAKSWGKARVQELAKPR